MKKVFSVFIIFFTINISYALTVEDVLRDIKSIPTVKVGTSQSSEKEREVYEQLKAVQIFVLPSDKNEIDNIFAKWKGSGINTIIVRCFHNNGDRYHGYIKSPLKEGVYFKTDAAPVIYDVLSELIPMAKRYNLKVFAWMTTRYANYGNENLENVIAYSLEQKKKIATKGMNIFSFTVQQHLLKIYEDLASYPIDGILLQDDLFLRYNEGFNNSTISLFKTETGFDAKPELFFEKNNKTTVYTEAFWNWRKWKSKKISELIAKIRDQVKSINPKIVLTVNLTYEAVSNPKGALAWLAHDLSSLKDVADYFSLMAYHRQIMDELKLDMPQTKQYIAEMITQCVSSIPESPQRFLFKLQVKDWHTNNPIDETEIRQLISSAKGLERLSVAVVPYPPDISISLLKEIFGKTMISQY